VRGTNSSQALVITNIRTATLNLIQRPRVDSRLISDNHFQVVSDVDVNNFAHGIGLRIFDTNQPEISVALANADDYLLLRAITPFAGLNVAALRQTLRVRRTER